MIRARLINRMSVTGRGYYTTANPPVAGTVDRVPGTAALPVTALSRPPRYHVRRVINEYLLPKRISCVLLENCLLNLPLVQHLCALNIWRVERRRVRIDFRLRPLVVVRSFTSSQYQLVRSAMLSFRVSCSRRVLLALPL